MVSDPATVLNLSPHHVAPTAPSLLRRPACVSLVAPLEVLRPKATLGRQAAAKLDPKN